MDNNFRECLDCLLAELKRIESRLQLQVMKLRSEAGRTGEDRFHGLYLSEGEVDSIMGSPPCASDKVVALSGEPDYLTPDNSPAQPESNVTGKSCKSVQHGQASRLRILERLFHLSALEVDTLLVCLLPELDLRYKKLYGYLQDDITKSNPMVDLLLHLVCETFEERLLARQSFLPGAPLMKYHLVQYSDDRTYVKEPLMARCLQIDERVIEYLLGIDRIDSRLLPFTHLAQSGTGLRDVVLPDETMHRLSRLAGQFKGESLVSYFRGNTGVGKKATAGAICSQLGTPLLVADVNRMVAADIPLELSVPLIFREGRLQNAALYFDGFDTLFSDEKETGGGYQAVINEISSYPQWVFLSGEKTWEPSGTLRDRHFVNVEFNMPSNLERRKLWAECWNGHIKLADGVDINTLADKFRLSGDQIQNAAATARSIALWRDPEQGLVTNDDLYSACRQQSRHKLHTLARKINPKYRREDIILPKDQMEQLREICCYVEHYYTVYSDWGFDRKLSLGKGLNVLFAGPSGTGKTMAAEIIASELGLELYKIDLSAIVSKYIGETEKNLDLIFREGQMSNAILFFDEADALFGKRSEVRDSHDRYANIEIAYLLQKMDEYDGVVILATNLRKNIDDAFARRMHFSLEFPIPEAPDRYRIWKSIFPSEAPLTGDIDLHFMANQFKITGGNIKNIALGAAFLAAEDGGRINIENLIRATKREYQKMGRLCTEGEFAQYFELVKG
jgi:ATP-dependent 26S proteasome regulatory subunit